MRHLDLFSGIGGFALAASWVWGEDHEIVGFVEYDPESKKPDGEQFNQLILNKNFPGVPVYGDIKKFCARKYKGTIDLITGGFPCQPYSVAGKQEGKADDRALWPEMFRIISETLPHWIIAENVPGIVNMELDQVLSDLESQGYAWEAYIIPACAADAPHRRDRVWIVAYDEKQVNRKNNPQSLHRSIQQSGKCNSAAIMADPEKTKCQFAGNSRAGRKGFADGSRHNGRIISDSMPTGEWGKKRKSKIEENVVPDSNQQGLPESSCREFRCIQKKNGTPAGSEFSGRIAAADRATWPAEPGVGRVADGIPDRVDRLKSLGNAIVPQVAAFLMQGIKEIDEIKYEAYIPA